MSPQSLSPELSQAIQLEGHRSRMLHQHNAASRYILELYDQTIGQIREVLSEPEQILLDCLTARTQLRALRHLGKVGTSAFNIVHSKNAKLHHEAKSKRIAVDEFLWMVDPDTGMFYDQDGEPIKQMV